MSNTIDPHPLQLEDIHITLAATPLEPHEQRVADDIERMAEAVQRMRAEIAAAALTDTPQEP